MSSRLPAMIRNLDDQSWLELLVMSVQERHIRGIEFPGFPPEEVQAHYVGSANATALREAFAFYVLAKDSMKDLGAPLVPESRLLDFGSGWGRFLRLFWKDVDEANLYGCDVNSTIVETCRSLNVPGRIDHIHPWGALPYPDAHFDAIVSYSVFTHLPLKAHLHWLRELARVARPGCVFCLTIEPRRFLDFVGSIPHDTDIGWHARLLPDQARLPDHYRRYDSGGLVFMPTHAGIEELFGRAVVPLSFIEREWSQYFHMRRHIDDPQRFSQAVIVVQRADSSPEASSDR